MHRTLLLQNFFKKSFTFMDPRRRASLLAAVDSLLKGADCTLTSLGKHIESPAKIRHQIRRVCRLLGNRHLHEERGAIFKALNQQIISMTHPVILVDWTCACYEKGQYILRASLVVKGRSLVCYEEAHWKCHENSPRCHQRFLQRLHQVLPPSVRPIIVTDAGFRSDWFKAVLDLNWYFVGRLRRQGGNVFDMKKGQWYRPEMLFNKATNRAQHLGNMLLSKRHRVACELIAYKNPPRGRRCKNKKGTPAKGSYHDAKAAAAKEPWLLVAVLPEEKHLAHKAVLIYQKRMQIEEEFRDTKNPRFGMGFSNNGTTCLKRIEILLLISALAMVVCWLIGCVVIKTGEYRDYCSNASKKKFSLSCIRLGRIAYQDKKRLWLKTLKEGLKLLKQLTITGHFIKEQA